MVKATLTAERARELLDYDPDTGVFRWKTGKFSKRPVRVVDGALYGRVYIQRKPFALHRLAWLIVHGEWPSMHIDHINGDKHDNRICNLRLATPVQNAQNVPKTKRNTSGFKGVSLCSATKRWRAEIRIFRKPTFLGRYACPTAAHIAYCKAAKEHFGEYARTD